MNNTYLAWLHELTVLCYFDDLIIPVDSEEAVKKLFDSGKTPEQAALIIKEKSFLNLKIHKNGTRS
jgi:hypothetical protein